MINKTTLYTSANCGGTILVTVKLASPKTVNARTIELKTVYELSPNVGNGDEEYYDGFPTDPDGEDWSNN